MDPQHQAGRQHRGALGDQHRQSHVRRRSARDIHRPARRQRRTDQQSLGHRHDHDAEPGAHRASRRGPERRGRRRDSEP